MTWIRQYRRASFEWRSMHRGQFSNIVLFSFIHSFIQIQFNYITYLLCRQQCRKNAHGGWMLPPDIHPASLGYISCRMIKKPTTKTDSTKFCRRDIVESNVLSSQVLLRRGWLVIWLDTSCTVAAFTVHLLTWVIYLHGLRQYLLQRDSVGPYHACLLTLLLLKILLFCS